MMSKLIFTLAATTLLFGSSTLWAQELWGVTGDGANTPETLYTIDTSNASTTFQLALGNGADGEAIGFNPNDGLIYHMSGISDGDEYYETVDPITLEIGPNIVQGNTYGQGGLGEFIAMEWYEPLGVFLAANRESDLFHVTTDGTFTNVGPTRYMRGLAIVNDRVYGIDPYDAFLYEIDPSDGSTIAVISMTLDGNGNTSGNGLATDPVTGIVYAVMKANNTRVLATIDVNTGAATSVGAFNDNFAAITFVNTTQYSLRVSGDCPGRVTVTWNNGTPNSQQGLIFGQRTGSTTIPNGKPCAGTVLGMAGNVRLVDPPGIFSNQGGSGSISGQVGTSACGHYLQLVEGGTCQTTNVAQIP